MDLEAKVKKVGGRGRRPLHLRGAPPPGCGRWVGRTGRPAGADSGSPVPLAYVPTPSVEGVPCSPVNS